jgi:hypothetical protein
MSKYIVVELIDSVIDQDFTGQKDSSLMYIRTRFIKIGYPVGTMKIQILDATKTTVICESESINCNFSSDPQFVGTPSDYSMSWIKFTMPGSAMRTGVKYYARLVIDATYIAGRDSTNYLCVVLDYPKPTYNDSLEVASGRNFAAYPHLLLQVFGYDYGESA